MARPVKLDNSSERRSIWVPSVVTARNWAVPRTGAARVNVTAGDSVYMSSYAVQRILQITELQAAQSVPFTAAVRLCDYCVLFLLHDYACKYIWLTMTWRNFDASWLSPPSCGWNSDKCFSLWYCWNTLRWRASDHTDIFINQRTECNLNNTINLRPCLLYTSPSPRD